MSSKNKIVMDFLLSRRSHSAKTLTDPIPNDDSLEKILTAAARSPDHGKLEPWRFLILEKKTMSKLANEVSRIGGIRGIDKHKVEKSAATFLKSPLIVAVVSSPKITERIPLIEQQLSAGAVCLSLLNAAHAEGWGANWLTGWVAYDEMFLVSVLGLSVNEFVAGFIHIGSPTVDSLERNRPDLQKITSRFTI
jgi:nitroreductase